MDAAPAMPRVPLWRRRPVVRLLVIALLAEIGYAALNLSTMPVYLTRDRGFGEAVLGLVLTAFLLAEAIGKSPMGHLADKYGSRRLMAFGPALSVVTALLSLVIPHTGAGPLEVLGFVLLRAMDGLGVAMLWPAAFSEMNASVEDDERQGAMSLLNTCYMVGIALAFPVGGIANDLSGTRWAGIVLAAALFAGVALAAWRGVPDRAPGGHETEDVHGGGIGDFVASMRQIPEYLLLAVVTFMAIGFPTFVFKLFPKDQFQYSETQIGMFVFPGAIALGALSVPMSRFGERVGRVRAVHTGLGLAAIGMALIASGMLVPPLRQPWVLAAGGLPIGIGFLLAIPAWMAAVADLDPRRRGTNLGAVMTAQGLGAILGAPLGAAMYEKLQPLGVSLRLGEGFGRYSPFAACAMALFAAWFLAMRVLRDRPPEGERVLTLAEAVGPEPTNQRTNDAVPTSNREPSGSSLFQEGKTDAPASADLPEEGDSR